MGVAERVRQIVEPVVEGLEDRRRRVAQQPHVVPGVLGALAPLVHDSRVGAVAAHPDHPGEAVAAGAVGPLEAGADRRPPRGVELGVVDPVDVVTARSEQLGRPLGADQPVVGAGRLLGQGCEARAHPAETAVGQPVG